MLETLAQKQAQLEQQVKDIQMAKIELDSAQSRCQAALIELRQNKGAEEHDSPKTGQDSNPNASLH